MAHSDAAKNAMQDARNALLNGGTLEIRSGTPGALASPTGTVLAVFTLGSPAFSAASGGSSSFNAVADTVAIAANAGGDYHFVAKSSGGAGVSDGTSGLITVSPTTWSIGDDVKLNSWSVS